MKTLIVILITIAFVLTGRVAFAQIGMGGTPHPSAVLDLKSPANNKAFYPPRLTTAQREAIQSPQAGALVFDTDLAMLVLYDGVSWMPMTTTSFSNLLISRTASDGGAGEYFGASVAISGDYALVGASLGNVNGNPRQGSAYVFVRSGSSWTQQAKLTASDGAGADQFGSSVAISGAYALVGANWDNVGNNLGQGSAYVFVRSGSTWTQQAKLTASDGAAGDNFGTSVAILGDYALVGAFHDDVGSNSDQGSAYMFVRSGTNWTQQVKLTASDGVFDDQFGTSVALSGDYALVGAFYDQAGSNSPQGSAYVFVRSGNTWTQQARLTASDGAFGDYFGVSVAISGDYALVGAPSDDVGSNTNQGSAYVFVRSGSSWTQQAKLTASDGAAGDYFGSSVAISGDYMLVGADLDAIGSNSTQGSAYVFVRSGNSWTLLRKITDNSPAYTNNGTSVGLQNGRFIIGGSGFQTNKGKVTFGLVE